MALRASEASEATRAELPVDWPMEESCRKNLLVSVSKTNGSEAAATSEKERLEEEDSELDSALDSDSNSDQDFANQLADHLCTETPEVADRGPQKTRHSHGLDRSDPKRVAADSAKELGRELWLLWIEVDERLGNLGETLEDSARDCLDEALEKQDPVEGVYGYVVDEVLEKEDSEVDEEVDQVVEDHLAHCPQRHRLNRKQVSPW